MPVLDAESIIAVLALTQHPEGGWYRETFRDSPSDGGRGRLTQIYYLLRKGEQSRWHRIDAVEVWHFYAGEPLMLRIAEHDGAAREVILGPDFLQGQAAHAVVPARFWQAAEPLGAFALLGCTVAPAFEFEGFELAPHGWRPARQQHLTGRNCRPTWKAKLAGPSNERFDLFSAACAPARQSR